MLPCPLTRSKDGSGGGEEEEENMGEDEALLSVETRLNELDASVRRICASELWSRGEIRRLQAEALSSKEALMEMQGSMKVMNAKGWGEFLLQFGNEPCHERRGH